MSSRPVSAVVVLLASALSFAVAPLQAQDAKPADTTFRVGLKDIAIPVISSEFVETGPDYRVLLEPLAPTSNRLVAAFVTPDDLKKLLTSASTNLTRYALVEVPRRAEFTDVTPELFKQVDESFGAQLGAQTEATTKDSQDELNRRLKALGGGSTSITLDKPLMLGTLFAKPDAGGYGEILPLAVNGATIKMAAGVTILRVRQRILFIYLYAPYKDETSVDWIRATGEKWVDAILAANK
ncbi:MAG TPA: hypothetical protein VGJ21_19445 [Terracidiphilus sp.]|jgi:hypothetical protein